ncbi:MAG: hypothetical protein UY26_C0002G0102 [Candidatus Jorgensenbacteria bacterium GW2011_GWA1_48_13]|uniref:Uncharacterized protein n=2 Tax=Candidatus Joergenseniibacteriota TaxID=1752739 RepID=A0A0G1Z8Q0_9BACT|nr:MAG: hypothetical protein UY26_C0002G0102 [Candidatus Jorgensenbacteria bacterium GW2011_GWA1_48_13]KKU99214.1 MAG: hypothetical protein UY32_C0004G0006 [Candidatus Jorgensenbacteria bacterium GW2011_GWC1_48_8]KKW15409.1 MAG: hypothetical protein UY55_C0001G0163 [Candidatus Jorgensenbacteria bacterium GW2011_GWB1_50_10]
MVRIAQEKSDTRLRAEMAQVAAEVLKDPDFGRKLSPEAKKRLLSVSEKDLSKAVSLSEIK